MLHLFPDHVPHRFTPPVTCPLSCHTFRWPLYETFARLKRRRAPFLKLSRDWWFHVLYGVIFACYMCWLGSAYDGHSKYSFVICFLGNFGLLCVVCQVYAENKSWMGRKSSVLRLTKFITSQCVQTQEIKLYQAQSFLIGAIASWTFMPVHQC